VQHGVRRFARSSGRASSYPCHHRGGGNPLAVPHRYDADDADDGDDDDGDGDESVCSDYTDRHGSLHQAQT
jgi:hypothetical protein